MRQIVPLLLLLAPLGCRQAAGPLEVDANIVAEAPEGVLTTEKASYAVGETAVVVLRNTYQHALGYNLCVSTLERQSGAGWRTAETDNDRVCTMELRTLQPGGSVTYSRLLQASLPAGEYRIRTTLEHLGSGKREPVASTTFRVTR